MHKRFEWLKLRDRASFVRLTGVLFLVYMAVGLWSPLMAVYAEEALGATTGQIGLVLAAFQLSSLLSQYWWGQRTDRLGRRKPLLLVGTGGLALVYLAIASVGAWLGLFAVRLLEGLALAAYNTGSLALMGDLLEDQAGRGRLMGIYRTFGSLAFALAALSGGWLADNFGLRVPFLVAAGCYALAFVLVMQVRERAVAGSELRVADSEAGSANTEVRVPGSGAVTTSAPPALETETRNLQRAALQRRALWPFMLLTFTWMFGMGAVVSFWPVYMGSIGYSKTEVGRLWALAAMGEVGGLILAGHLADLWGRKRVMLTGLVSMAGVFLAYTISAAGWWMVGVQLFRSFAYSCFEAPALLYATELGLRQQRGRLAGLYYSANGAGGIAGSTLGGGVAQQIGLPATYRAVVVLMLLVALVAGRIMPRLRAGEEAQYRDAEAPRAPAREV
jgi:PPP family 3-phenylpropionic acid transporter